jgi:putative DNA-invertase from lambdoid prophage Rac
LRHPKPIQIGSQLLVDPARRNNRARTKRTLNANQPSQAQAEATKEAQRAGIEHAKASGETYRGRKPSYSREQLAMVQDMLGQSANIIAIAKATNLSRQTVYRIKDDPAAAEAALATWEA